MKQQVKGFSRLLDGIIRLQAAISTSLLGVIVVLYSYEIIRRVLTGRSYAWVSSLTLLLFVWMVFLGLAFVYDRREDIRLSFFVDRLPVKGQAILGIIVGLLTIVFFLFLLRYVPMLISFQMQRDSVLPIRRYMYTLPILIASVTVLLLTLRDLVHLIAGAERGKGAEPHNDEPTLSL